jgi:hypothetical protein
MRLCPPLVITHSHLHAEVPEFYRVQPHQGRGAAARGGTELASNHSLADVVHVESPVEDLCVYGCASVCVCVCVCARGRGNA